MKSHESLHLTRADHQSRFYVSRDAVSLVAATLPILDFIAVLLAALVASLLLSPVTDLAASGSRAAFAAAALAPLVLFDASVGSRNVSERIAFLFHCFGLRFAILIGVTAAIGLWSETLKDLPQAWLAIWIGASLTLMLLARAILVIGLRVLERSGVVRDRIAIVGSGPVADQLIRHLLLTRGRRVEIVGVYDDACDARSSADQHCEFHRSGSIADLIELGKQGTTDWILLTQATAAEGRMMAIVHRLKALAVPIGLCPEDLLARTTCGAALGRGWAHAVTAVVPAWIVTFAGMPLRCVRPLVSVAGRAVMSSSIPGRPQEAMAYTLDDYDIDRFTQVAAGFGCENYGYAVTPNADHLIRLHEQPAFRTLYAQASFVLLDSRFISNLLRITGRINLPVCTGSDLTAKLFGEVIQPDDRIVLLGASAAQAAQLVQHYGLNQLAHFNPPMGFIRDPASVEECLQFIESNSPFRYCLLAVGAPQQEAVAHMLKQRGVARGLALCIGASINFLTGDERRAPRWMQRCGIEWLFRLMQAPGRMAHRYLIRGPKIFALLRHARIVLRPALATP